MKQNIRHVFFTSSFSHNLVGTFVNFHTVGVNNLSRVIPLRQFHVVYSWVIRNCWLDLDSKTRNYKAFTCTLTRTLSCPPVKRSHKPGPRKPHRRICNNLFTFHSKITVSCLFYMTSLPQCAPTLHYPSMSCLKSCIHSLQFRKFINTSILFLVFFETSKFEWL